MSTQSPFVSSVVSGAFFILSREICNSIEERYNPAECKRVPQIFENPQFYIDGGFLHYHFRNDSDFTIL